MVPNAVATSLIIRSWNGVFVTLFMGFAVFVSLLTATFATLYTKVFTSQEVVWIVSYSSTIVLFPAGIVLWNCRQRRPRTNFWLLLPAVRTNLNSAILAKIRTIRRTSRARIRKSVEVTTLP